MPQRSRVSARSGEGARSASGSGAEEFGLVALRHDADAGESARGTDGGVGIGGERDIGGDPDFRGAAGDGGGDILREAEEAVEPGDVERDRVGRGLLDGGGELEGERRQIAVAVKTGEHAFLRSVEVARTRMPRNRRPDAGRTMRRARGGTSK